MKKLMVYMVEVLKRIMRKKIEMTAFIARNKANKRRIDLQANHIQKTIEAVNASIVEGVDRGKTIAFTYIWTIAPDEKLRVASYFEKLGYSIIIDDSNMSVVVITTNWK
jgi:hypothetical protein